MSDYATDIITVGEPLPTIASVEAGNGRYDVQVMWAGGARAGRTDTVDLAPMIFTFKVFKPLRDGTVAFDTVRLGDYGASIVWPGDTDLDIGADAIEEMAAEAMTNEDFSAFLKRNKLTLDAAAAQLGIARRLVAYYAKEREIPRYIALACRQLDLMLGGAPASMCTLGDHNYFVSGIATAEPSKGAASGVASGVSPISTENVPGEYWLVGSLQTPIKAYGAAMPDDSKNEAYKSGIGSACMPSTVLRPGMIVKNMTFVSQNSLWRRGDE